MSPSQLLIRIVGGVIVVASSFWITLRLLDDGTSGQSSNEIRIIEATYGLNCASRAQNAVAIGNATKDVTELCDRKTGDCEYLVDVARLGDPAPGCAKDFAVKWNCGGSRSSLQIVVQPEAYQKSAKISCPR